MTNKITLKVIEYEKKYGRSITKWQDDIVQRLQEEVHQIEEDSIIIQQKKEKSNKFTVHNHARGLVDLHERRQKTFDNIENIKITKKIFVKNNTTEINTVDKDFFYLANLIVKGIPLSNLIEKGYSPTKLNEIFLKIYKSACLFISNDQKEIILSDSQKKLYEYLKDNYKSINLTSPSFNYAISKGNNIGPGQIQIVSIVLPVNLLDNQGKFITKMEGKILSNKSNTDNL